MNLTVSKIKRFKFIFYFIVVFICLISYLKSSKPNKKNIKVKLDKVIIHLDLKGAPPNLVYLKNLLPILKELGANGFLIEYEDMFPYQDEYVDLSAKSCYTESELRAFLKEAISLDFELIPLIQTFGHMEFVLKLEKFQFLREIPLYPDSICPSKTRSKEVLSEMIKQVVRFHNSISPLKYIHIGCDEVYHINSCSDCTRRNMSDVHLFVQHVQYVTELVQKFSPGTEVLIWDDMLRGKTAEQLDLNKLGDVHLVYWDYRPNISVRAIDIHNYQEFLGRKDRVWIASAFKGADGPVSILPSLIDRVENHYSWLNFVAHYRDDSVKGTRDFKGIILTGWSRYAHMESIVELLPATLHSIVINLLLIQKYKEGFVNDNVKTLNEFFLKYLSTDVGFKLKCYRVAVGDLNKFDVGSCDFDGVHLYKALRKYEELKAKVLSAYYDKFGLASIDYKLKMNNVNMNNILRYTNMSRTYLEEIDNVSNELAASMKPYYSNNVISEYIDSYTLFLKDILNSFMTKLQAYDEFHTWNRRQ